MRSRRRRRSQLTRFVNREDYRLRFRPQLSENTPSRTTLRSRDLSFVEMRGLIVGVAAADAAK